MAGTFAYLKSQIDEFGVDEALQNRVNNRTDDIIVKKVTSMFSSLTKYCKVFKRIGKFFEKLISIFDCSDYGATWRRVAQGAECIETYEKNTLHNAREDGQCW